MNGRLYRFSLIVVCLFGLLPVRQATAQVAPDVQKRYQAAIKQVQTGEYERAKPELNAIIQGRGPLAPYANYYYALAEFRQRNFAQARMSTRQLMEGFPNWRKMDDANYLYAATCMETGQYEEAMAALQKIGDPSLRPDVAKLEQ